MSVPLYPYTNASGDEEKLRNRFIVQSFYASMVTENDGSENAIANNRFDTEYLKDLMSEIINGKASTIGYEKGIQNEEALNGEESGWLTRIINFFKWISDNIIELFGSAPGTLGLRSATQDGFMGNFLYYSMMALPFISLVLIIIMMALYTKNRMGLLTSAFYTIVGVCGLFILIYLAPKYLADITNFIPNNGSNQLAFDSLMLRQEVNTESNNIKASYSDFGRFGFAESSITLYAFKDEQLKEVCETYSQDVRTIMSGNSFVIDEDSGLFVQGNKLKISLDKVLDSIDITVKANTMSNVSVYTLEKKEYVETVLNYYFPYDVIMDGLINQLNKLSQVYLLTRNQLPYPNNVFKDAFFMDSYVRSPIFISPRDPKAADESMSDDTLQKLESLFMQDLEVGNEDFLGLLDSLTEHKASGKSYETLWYQTMEQNHYFDEEVNTTMMANLISYVNNNTREFLVKNIDKLKYMSDDTLIKVTSLYASMMFNTQVSSFYNKLYPERINYEELSVVDTIRPIITKDYNKFSEKSRDIVDYVYSEYGFFGNLALAVIVLLQGITSLILTYAIFIMYLLLILFILIRLVIKRDGIKNAVQGFLKLYLILIGVYMVNVFSFQILNNFESSGLTLFFIVLLSTLVCGMSSSVVLYTITGFATLDFSNDRSWSGMLKVLDKVSFGLLQGAINSVSNTVGSMFSSSLRVGNKKDNISRNVSNIDLSYSRYEDSSRVDDYIRSRYEHYDSVDSTEDFYNRRNIKYGRASRMKKRVEIDIEDDGDYL